jgi:hypothetical protein
LLWRCPALLSLAISMQVGSFEDFYSKISSVFSSFTIQFQSDFLKNFILKHVQQYRYLQFQI